VKLANQQAGYQTSRVLFAPSVLNVFNGSLH